MAPQQVSLGPRQRAENVIADGVRRGLLHNTAEDARLDGRIVTVGNARLVNFGSCSYLGLEMHPNLLNGVKAAVERFGTQFASSRSYLSSPGYRDAEDILTSLFGRPTLLAPTTTLGHISAVPALVGEGDALLIDRQVHNSVRTAAQLVRNSVKTVAVVPHNDVGFIESKLKELSATHDKIWYLADGLYSMHADFAPIHELASLVESYAQFWLYIDDAHSLSWMGARGEGFALSRLIGTPATERTIVAGSLVKSFAASGGVLALPDVKSLDRIRAVGGPMVFSGPVQPPMLGAVIESAKLHINGHVADRQQRLLSLIRLFNSYAEAMNLAPAHDSLAPIRCIEIGSSDATFKMCRRLREAGFFVNPAVYPAVPEDHSGIRIALTCHHTEDDVRNLIESISDCMRNTDQQILSPQDRAEGTKA